MINHFVILIMIIGGLFILLGTVISIGTCMRKAQRRAKPDPSILPTIHKTVGAVVIVPLYPTTPGIRNARPATPDSGDTRYSLVRHPRPLSLQKNLSVPTRCFDRDRSTRTPPSLLLEGIQQASVHPLRSAGNLRSIPFPHLPPYTLGLIHHNGASHPLITGVPTRHRLPQASTGCAITASRCNMRSSSYV